MENTIKFMETDEHGNETRRHFEYRKKLNKCGILRQVLKETRSKVY